MKLDTMYVPYKKDKFEFNADFRKTSLLDIIHTLKTIFLLKLLFDLGFLISMVE